MSRLAGKLLNLLLVVLIGLSLMAASGRAYDQYVVSADAGTLTYDGSWSGAADASLGSERLEHVGIGSYGLSVSAGRSESLRAMWPTAVAMRWRAPRGWLREAFCIHRHESVDWYRAYVDWQGNPSSYSGGMQFRLSTWRRAGGTGHPHEWRPREQVYRAFVIWRANGGSWSEWGSAGKCGL